MKERNNLVINLRGTLEGYLLHFPESATEDPMPLHDKIIQQLLGDIQAQEAIIQAADGVAEALSRWQTFDARIHTGMNAAEFHLRSVAALEKYNSLKENNNGKI